MSAGQKKLSSPSVVVCSNVSSLASIVIVSQVCEQVKKSKHFAS